MHIVIHSMGMPFDGDTLKTASLGGSESAAYYLARGLLALGHRVDVWTAKEGCDGFFDGVRYAWVGVPSERAPCGERFEQYAVNTPFDVLIVQRHPLAFHKRYGAKVCVWQLHDLALHRSMPVVSHGLWQIDAITGVSRWHVEQIKEVYGFKASHHHAVPNGVDLSLYERREAGADKTLQMLEANRDFKLLYQSRPERGLEHLVRPGGIMERLKETDAHLFVCGYGNTTAQMAQYYAQLEAWGEALPNVTALGTLTKAELAQVQMRCDALFYPSNFCETSCISAMEAMAAGLPILGSRVGALPETCTKAGALLLPLANGEPDIERFVSVVKDWAERPSVLDELRACQLAAAPQWSWANAAARLDEVLRGLFAERSASFSRNLRHCVEHSDIVFAEWLIERHTRAQELTELDAIAAKSIDELRAMYAFADDGPKLAAHYALHQGKYYDEHEARVVGEDVTQTTRFRGVQQFVAEAAAERKGQQLRVLDYGCAHGHYLIPLARMFPAAQLTGVDISARAIKAALAWARKEQLANVAFIVGDQSALEPRVLCEQASQALATGTDGEVLPAEYELFDVIVAGEIVEHVRDYLGLLGRLASLLRPGGVLVVTTPAGRWEWTGREAFKSGREHLHHFERPDIEEICAGKEVDIVYAPAEPDASGFPLGSWVWAVKSDGKPFRPVDYERKAAQLAPRETVSACLIVKDGEEQVRQCIGRFADWVDEVVVAIDGATTDCTDDALERVREEHPWLPMRVLEGKTAARDGFAEARNLALDASCGDWVLWLDADETMQTPWAIHRLLRRSALNGCALGQLHFAVDPPAVIGTDWPCRLFRRDSGARFHGLVHEHPEVVKGEAIPHTYMRPETRFLHTGYVDEGTRRARFRRNWPLLQRDMEANPDRKLNVFLMLRDVAQSMAWEMQQARGHLMNGHAEMARTGVRLFEQVMKFRQIKMLIDCMEHYSLCCEVLGSGFEIDVKFQVTHPQARDLSAVIDLKGRVYSREHLRQLLQLVTDESTKHYESQYL